MYLTSQDQRDSIANFVAHLDCYEAQGGFPPISCHKTYRARRFLDIRPCRLWVVLFFTSLLFHLFMDVSTVAMLVTMVPYSLFVQVSKPHLVFA